MTLPESGWESGVGNHATTNIIVVEKVHPRRKLTANNQLLKG